MKQINVMVVGAGGNCSWWLHYINDLITKNQIPDYIEFTIFDGDEVEKKNLLYQDFELLDVMQNKAKVLGIRYAMRAEQKFVKEEKDFDKFDIVVAGVDNPDFRRLLFRYMDKHPEKYWIDMRAEGRVAAFYTKHKKNTLEYLLATLPAEGVSVSTSCQLKYELDNGIIQQGNKIVAMMASQLFLNHIRGEQNPAEFVHMF